MRMSHQCNNFHCLASLARGAGTFPSLLPHSRCRKSFEIFSSFDYYFTFFTNFINQKANPSQLKDFSDGDAKVLKFKKFWSIITGMWCIFDNQFSENEEETYFGDCWCPVRPRRRITCYSHITLKRKMSLFKNRILWLQPTYGYFRFLPWYKFFMWHISGL